MRDCRHNEAQGTTRPVYERRVPAWLIWAVLIAALTAAWFLAPWQEAWTALARAGKIWIAAAIGICFFCTPIMATQWWLFVPRQYRLGWTRMFKITALTMTARATLPFLAGDASAVGLLTARGGLSLGAAALVLTLDHLFAGIAKVAMVCATLALASLPPFLVAAGASLAGLVLCLLITMLVSAVYGRSLHAIAAWFPAPVEKSIRGIASLTAHLELLRRPLRAGAALGLTLLRKAAEIAVTFSVQRAMGIALPLGDVILVVTAVDLAG